jgi:Tol biopolymer transport system component
MIMGSLVAYAVIGGRLGQPTEPSPSADALQRLIAAGVVRVAVRPDHPQALTPSGGADGFDVDVATDLGRRLGLRVEVVAVSPADLFGQPGKWDVGLSSTPAWTVDSEAYLSSSPYYAWPHLLLVPAESGATSVADVKGQPITDKGTCGGGDMPGGYSPDGSPFVFTRAKCGSGPVPDRNQSAALYVADADGGNLRQLTPFGVAWSHEEGLARWSPDGSKILFAGAKGNLFTISPDGGHMKQITLDVSGSRSFAIAPDWSPDGSKIVFNLFIDGPSGIYTADADGSNLALIAADGPDFVDEPDWGAAAP